jgi:murein lipoprotein
MKARITLAASGLALLSLTGCASPAQIDEQNKQLAAINVSLMKIQENQLKSIEFQQDQGALQIQSNNVQKQQYELQVRGK